MHFCLLKDIWLKQQLRSPWTVCETSVEGLVVQGMTETTRLVQESGDRCLQLSGDCGGRLSTKVWRMDWEEKFICNHVGQGFKLGNPCGVWGWEQANELPLALDVYNKLVEDGCSPNLVTFNILIDVYGKTGQWQDAMKVLDALDVQVEDSFLFYTAHWQTPMP